MKRDKELLRKLILRFEQDEHGLLLFGVTNSSTAEEIRENYHIQLLVDHGLVTPVSKHGFRLTSTGHDAVEALNKNALWEQLKAATPKEAYELLKGVTSSLAVTAISKVMGWG